MITEYVTSNITHILIVMKEGIRFIQKCVSLSLTGLSNVSSSNKSHCLFWNQVVDFYSQRIGTNLGKLFSA